jgi:hypothetical protein
VRGGRAGNNVLVIHKKLKNSTYLQAIFHHTQRKKEKTSSQPNFCPFLIQFYLPFIKHKFAKYFLLKEIVRLSDKRK